MSAARQRQRAGRWLGAYVLAYLVFLYLPVSLIPLFSFNDSIQAAFPLQGFTLDWYRTLCGNPALSRRAWQQPDRSASPPRRAPRSAASPIAYMDLYGRSPLAAAISAIARLPILIPGVIVGISLLILVNLAGFGPSRHGDRARPHAGGAADHGGDHAQPLRRHPEEHRARRRSISARATGRRSAGSCCRSACRPIASAFMLAFLTSFDEFIVAFFLAGTEPTLPLYIWASFASRNRCRPSWRWARRSSPSPSSSPPLAEFLRHRGLAAAARPVPADPSNQKKPKRRTAMAFDLTIDACEGARGRLAAVALPLSSAAALAAGQAAIFHLVGLRASRIQQELPRRASGRRRGLDVRRRRRRLHQGQGRLPPRCRASLLRQGGALEQGRPAAADRHQAHQELGFDLPGVQEPARPAGRRRQGLDGAVGLGQHLDPLPHRPGQEPRAELEPAVGQAICRPHGDHRRRARHAAGRGAACRRQSVRHDRRGHGQGRRQAARAAAAAVAPTPPT